MKAQLFHVMMREKNIPFVTRTFLKMMNQNFSHRYFSQKIFVLYHHVFADLLSSNSIKKLMFLTTMVGGLEKSLATRFSCIRLVIMMCIFPTPIKPFTTRVIKLGFIKSCLGESGSWKLRS